MNLTGNIFYNSDINIDNVIFSKIVEDSLNIIESNYKLTNVIFEILFLMLSIVIIQMDTSKI